MGKDFDIEKLKGQVNYHNWCFAMKNYLQFKGLSDCIKDPPTEDNDNKLSNCKALLALSVEPCLYNHISNCNSAVQIWQTLQNLFEEKGLTRKIGILRNLITSRLEDCDSMQSYIDRIVDNTNKLNGIGFEINDDWQTAIILAGLTEVYKPFIMGIEASGVKITSEIIIAKLLDTEMNSTSIKPEAFVAKRFEQKNKFRYKTKCTTCGKRHAGQCRYKGNQVNGGSANNAFTALIATSNSDDWYIDSGASAHMTPNEVNISNKQRAMVEKGCGR